MLLLRDDSTVIISNQYSNEIVDHNPRIRFVNGKLVVAGMKERLRDEIASVVKSHSEGVGMPKRYLTVGDDHDNDNLLIELSPLIDKHSEVENSLSGVVALLIDPNAKFALNEEGLKTVYSLTPAEIDVAKHVSDGCGYSEVADRRNSSPETVKKQMKSLFEKTLSSSRASLIRRMMSISLPFRD